jgi:hypothetical protein
VHKCSVYGYKKVLPTSRTTVLLGEEILAGTQEGLVAFVQNLCKIKNQDVYMYSGESIAYLIARQ